MVGDGRMSGVDGMGIETGVIGSGEEVAFC